MNTVRDLDNLRLYRGKRIPLAGKNKKQGSVVIGIPSNETGMKELISSGLFYREQIRNIYTSRSMGGNMLRGRKILNDQREYYKTIKEEIPFIQGGKLSIKDFNTTNFYYDAGFETQTFFENVVTMSRRRLEFFTGMLSEMINSPALKGYTEKVVVIIVNDVVNDVKDLENIDSRHPISNFYNMIKYKMVTPGQFDGVNFIFFNPRENMFFKTDLNLGPSTLPKFKNLATTFLKLNRDEYLSHAEGEEVSPEVSPVTDAEMDHNYKEDMKTAVVKRVMSLFQVDAKVHALSGDDFDDMDVLEEIIDKAVKEGSNSDEEIMESLEDNAEFIDLMSKVKDKKIKGNTDVIKDKHVQKLQMDQDDITIGKVSLKDVLEDFRAKAIEVDEIPVDTIHDQIKISKLRDFDKSYNDNQSDKDLAAIVSFMSEDSELPVFVKEFIREDSSDEFNKKETITIKFEDANRVRHMFRMDVPVFMDNRFMYINGGKKSLSKQVLLLPVVKTKPDTVQVTSNYNKLFVMRYGQKADPMVSRFEKFMRGDLTGIENRRLLKFNLGDNSMANSSFVNTIEFDEISAFLMEISIAGFQFNFNRAELLEELRTNGILEDEPMEHIIPIGYEKNRKTIVVYDTQMEAVFVRSKTGKTWTDEKLGDTIVNSLVNLMSQLVDQRIPSMVSSNNAGKRFMYSRVMMNNKKVPLVMLLSYKDGLSNVMKKYGIEYEFTEKKRKMTPEETASTLVLQFKDGFLYYPNKPLRFSLLLNGLVEINTKDYNFSDFDGEELYLDWFKDTYGSRNVAKGFRNTMSLMIDPITADILADMELPVEFTSLLLHVNSLLENTQYNRQNDLSNYRIRGNEQINAYFYKILADSFRNYRDSTKAGNKDVRITAPQNELLKRLLESPMVDEYSVLNPILEAENMGTSTYKGLSGINLEDAFGIDIRSYDKSMQGTLGLNTPDSAKVGVVRQLTYNPNIINNRGFIKKDINRKTMNPVDMLTPSELLSPFTSTHADPPRIGMQVTQSKHIIPTIQQDKPLFGSGIEKTLPHLLSSDFVSRAKKDGVIELIDSKTELMIVKYDDGSRETVDLSSVSSKNSNGGFYITNMKTPNVRQGERFSKGNILASNKEFFHGGKDNTTYVTGKLTKVAITSGDFTYEDSSIITEGLSKAMASKITMKTHVNLGPNANVHKLVKKGDFVKTGDALMVFENSFNDSSANELLAKLGEEFGEAINELGKNIKKSKYSGEVVDMRIYFNRPIEDFSESLQKVITAYITEVEKKKSLVKKAYEGKEADNIIFPPTRPITREKINGEDLDGIMIEFYVRYNDEMFTGDKIAFQTALKSIISDVIKTDEAPYSESKPDEEVTAIVSPLSIVSRMTTDVYNQLWLNKALLGLKDRVRDIYKG